MVTHGLLALCFVRPAAGHEAIEGQIDDLDRRIQSEPADAVLYLRRAELHRIHRDWGAAMADYHAARRLDPGLATVDLCLGRTYLERDRPRQAKAALDGYLRKRPADAEGLTLRGRALARLGRLAEAADDYRRALASPAREAPDPNTYLELANLLMASGGEGHREEALRTLDQGIAALGPIVALQLPAIEIEVSLGRFDEALRRLDTVEPRAGRRERWLLKRAEILWKAGRAPEAGRTYREVLVLIESLPQDRRAVAAVKEAAEQARAGLARFGAGEHPTDQEAQ